MKVYEILDTGDPYEPDFTVAIASTKKLAEEICATLELDCHMEWKLRSEYSPNLHIRETEVVTSIDHLMPR